MTFSFFFPFLFSKSSHCSFTAQSRSAWVCSGREAVQVHRLSVRSRQKRGGSFRGCAPQTGSYYSVTSCVISTDFEAVVRTRVTRENEGSHQQFSVHAMLLKGREVWTRCIQHVSLLGFFRGGLWGGETPGVHQIPKTQPGHCSFQPHSELPPCSP